MPEPKAGISIRTLELDPNIYRIPLPDAPRCPECGGEVYLSLRVGTADGAMNMCEAHERTCPNLYT